MNPKIWISGIFAIAFSSMLAGAVLYAQLVPSEIIEIPFTTERLVEVEVPVVTEKLVEIDREIVVQMPQQVQAEHGPNLLLPENGEVPIFRWVDPKNLNVIYIVPDGYNTTVVPMHMSVPEEWFTIILNDYAYQHPEGVPPAFMDWLPRDWLKVTLPGELKYRLTENTDTILPTNINGLAP